MEKKITGFFGVSIPIIFIISFSVFYIFINPNSFKNELSLVMYNIKDLNGREIVNLLNYSFLGLVLIFFNILFIKNFNNSATNLIGKISLLISSLIYTSIGFISRQADFNSALSDYNILQYTGVLLFGFLGLFFLAFDFEKICKLKIIKSTIVIVCIYIFIEFIIHFTIVSIDLKYPPIIAKTTWLIYFLTYGLIGGGIIIDSNKTSHKY